MIKKQLTLLDKIKSQQTSITAQSLQVKLQKIKLYISNSDEDLPHLSASDKGTDKVATMLRMYFNDKQLLIFKDYQSPQSYLEQKQFQTRISDIFNQFLQDNPHYMPHKSNESIKPQKNDEKQQTQESKPKPTSKKSQFSQQKEQSIKIDFIQFVEYWIQKMSDVKIFYEKYQDTVKNSVENFQTNLYKTVSNNASKQNSPRQENNNKKQNKLKESISNQQKQNKDKEPPVNKNKIIEKKQSKENHQKQRKQQRKSSKHSISSKKQEEQEEQNYQKQQQEQYQNQFDPSVSRQKSVKSVVVNDQIQEPKDSFTYYLRKFYDHYCKKAVNTIKNQQFNKLINFYNSMNLTKFMMYAKDVKLLKINKTVTAKYLQTLFKNNQNKQHSLEFDSFLKVIREVLQTQYKEKQQFQTKGYEYIGVRDRPNFAAVMGKLGVIVPLKKIIFSKQQDKRALDKMVKSRMKQQNMKQSLLLKDSTVGANNLLKNGGYGHGYQSNWDSNKLQKDLFMNQKQRKQQRLLQGLTIPKLNKLQPSKHMDDKLHQLVDQQYDPYLKRYNQKNVSGYEASNNNGVIKRIDERIQNVVKKIR